MPVKVNVTKFSKSKQNIQTTDESAVPTVEQPVVEQTIEQPVVVVEDDIDNDMPDFLDALTNDKYVNKKQLQEEAKQKELDAKERDKQRKESLRQKRILLNKVQSYKELFKEELKGFKIKKNCSTEELKEYIAEMDCIIETGTVETFMSDSIYSCIKIIEGVSATTKKYDVSGLSMLLQNNKQFNSLLKQLFLKYQVFSNVPPEYQLVLIVSTSAYICRNKNLNKESLNAFFNEPILVPDN
jgi:hypothetical protein